MLFKIPKFSKIVIESLLILAPKVSIFIFSSIYLESWIPVFPRTVVGVLWTPGDYVEPVFRIGRSQRLRYPPPKIRIMVQMSILPNMVRNGAGSGARAAMRHDVITTRHTGAILLFF